MQYLRADTNTEVLIGVVVAVGDGFTPVTTLDPSTADEAELIKYGGSTPLTTTSISASTMTAITGADGYYTLDLSTGNTDTEGFLTVLFNDDSLCLPVRHDFQVLNANVYDSLFAAAATDYLDTNIVQAAGTAWASGAITASALGADCITAAKIGDDAFSAEHFATDAIDANAFATDAVSEITAAIKALVVESQGSITFGQAMSLILAFASGEASGQDTATAVFKSPNGVATRITATTDGSGNRTAVTPSPST